MKIRKLIAFILGAFGGFLFLEGVAGAETMTDAVPTTVSLEPWVVAILSGTITPLLTGLITKLSASSGFKAVIGLAMVAIASCVNLIVNNDGQFILRDVVVVGACTFAMHVSSYYGLWKPVGAKNLAPEHGIS